jgi:uncharacterized protein YndB with AHSA1/START domain
MTTEPTTTGLQDDRTVVLRRAWPDPIDDVWSALTESDRTARWIGTWDDRTETTVQFTMTGEVDAGGEVAPPVTVTIVECDPPRRLVLDIPGDDGPPWRVAVTLIEEGGGTTLLFEQWVIAGVSPDDVEAGWSWYLDRLGAALHDAPMPAWTEYAPAENPAKEES